MLNKAFSFKLYEKIYYCRPVENGEGFIVTDNPDDNFGEWVDCWEGVLGFVPWVPGDTLKEKVEFIHNNSDYNKEIQFQQQMKEIIDA